MSEPTTSPYWKLDGTAVVEATFEEWSQNHVTRLARDEHNGVVVSTCFIGLNISGEAPPIVFETMVFGGTHDGERRTYSTWVQAAIGHGMMCQKIFGGKDASSGAP